MRRSEAGWDFTLELVRRSYDSHDVHLDLSVFGLLFSDPPSHPEEEVARREPVSTHRVAEGVTGSETHLQSPVGVTERLWENQEYEFNNQ